MHARHWFTLARHDDPPAAPADGADGGDADAQQMLADAVDSGQSDAKPDTGDDKDWKTDAEKWKSLARKHEQQSKANADKAKSYDEFVESQKSETEKAISEAEKRGHAAAMKTAGELLARAEFKAEAAGKLADAEAILDDLNLAKYVAEDGKVDSEAIKAAVARFASTTPKPPAPDLHQGARPGEPVDFRAASREDLAAELAKYGVKTRS